MIILNGGWLSWPPPPSLVMHALNACSEQRGEASIEDEEPIPTKGKYQEENPRTKEGVGCEPGITKNPRIHKRLPPLPHRHSGFCSVPAMDFLAEFLVAAFRWHLLFVLQKNTHRKFGKNSVENFGENNPFFGAFFGAFFGTFLGAFFGEQLFASKSEKFVQNPFCKRDPLKNCRRLPANFAQNCRHFVSYIKGRVRKIVANLSRI